jgi:hypothetical protein
MADDARARAVWTESCLCGGCSCHAIISRENATSHRFSLGAGDCVDILACGGESLLRVHWVAVPEAWRARRIIKASLRRGGRGACTGGHTMLVTRSKCVLAFGRNNRGQLGAIIIFGIILGRSGRRPLGTATQSAPTLSPPLGRGPPPRPRVSD